MFLPQKLYASDVANLPTSQWSVPSNDSKSGVNCLDYSSYRNGNFVDKIYANGQSDKNQGDISPRGKLVTGLLNFLTFGNVSDVNTDNPQKLTSCSADLVPFFVTLAELTSKLFKDDQVSLNQINLETSWALGVFGRFFSIFLTLGLSSVAVIGNIYNFLETVVGEINDEKGRPIKNFF